MTSQSRAFARRLVLRDLFRNTAALYGTTVVTSVLGFGFWVLADREFPINDVGIASASISAMQLLGEFGLLGMSTLIIAELARVPRPVGLVSASALLAGAASSVLAIGYVFFQHVVSTKLGPLGHGFVGPAIFVIGVGLNAISYVLDYSTVGIGRGSLQLWRNGVFAAVKVLLLLPSALITVEPKSELIYLSWICGIAVSFVWFWVQLRRAGIRPRLRPNVSALVAARVAAFAHHWMNLAAQVSRLVLPVMVAATLSAKLTAVFYTISVVVSFVGIISTHLSTALFALPRGDLERLAVELRSALRFGLAIACVGAVFFAILAHPVLEIFGHEYAAEATTMALLGVSAIPTTVKSLYMAVERVRGHLLLCAAICTVGGCFEVAMAYVGSRLYGLPGVAGGLDLATLAEAILLWPIVARAARVPVLGLPTWLWRSDAEAPNPLVAAIALADGIPLDASDGTSGLDGSAERDADTLAGDTSPPADSGTTAELATAGDNAPPADPGPAEDSPAPENPALLPSDQLFTDVERALADLRGTRRLARVRPGWRLIVAARHLIGPLRRVETVRVPLSVDAAGELLREMVTWPAGPWTLPRPVMSVLDLAPEDGLPRELSPEVTALVDASVAAGLTLAVLEKPAVRIGLYAACLGVGPDDLVRADPGAVRVLQAPGSVVLAALNAQDEVLAVALATYESAHALLNRLITAPAAPAATGSLWLLHTGLCEVLARSGVRFLWSEEPLGGDMAHRALVTRLGYECRRLRLAAEEG